MKFKADPKAAAMTCQPVFGHHASSVRSAARMPRPTAAMLMLTATIVIVAGALAENSGACRESGSEGHPQITPTLPDTLPHAAQQSLEGLRALEPMDRWNEALSRLENLEVTEDADPIVSIGPAIEELVILTFTPLRPPSGVTLSQRTEWRLRVFGFRARLLAIAEQLRPPIDDIDGRPVGEFVRRHQDEWLEVVGADFLRGSPLDDLSWISDPGLLEEAGKLKALYDFANDMVWVDRSFRRLVTTNSNTLESSIRNLSDTRGLSRLDFYQTRLAMLELVVEHCPDEELVKRLFPTGVVPPPPVMGDFEGRDEIEDREAELMERLKVDSARRQEQRAGRLEQMIEVWDQARREAKSGGAGDREQGR